MAAGVHGRSRRPVRGSKGGSLRRWPTLALALASASCVPVGTGQVSPTFSAAGYYFGPETPPTPAAPDRAQLMLASLVEADTPFAFRGRTELDRLRSLDCLAQAIYYEAASESENGQRAVAQVVLNRVRHPAWPNSVCGVVYQGPMRAGGGCQFTFTCDGSLAVRPSGIAWARARMLAAEALAGYVHAPVGLSTHYHTHEVSPHWAPGLHKTTVIGAHNFYRLPGAWGEGSAFTASYSGTEPLPRPSMTLLRRPAAPATAGLPWAPPPATAAAPRSDIPQDPRWVATDLPSSGVREEYRNSGRWRDDAPAAITGR